MRKAPPFIEFGEIAEFRNGINFNKDSHGVGCWLIGVADFQNYFTPNYDSLDEVNPEGITKEDDYLKKSDLIFVRSNGNKALVGRSLYIDRDVKALFSGFCIRARLTNDIIDPLFLAYYTRTNHFKASISSVAGTNINNLNQDILSNVKLPLYPKVVQLSITKVLSALDTKIELNQRINAELEAMAKTLYDYWFVQFDFPDEEGKPYKSSGGKMVWNEALKREIPEGWEVKKLADWIESDKSGDWGSDEPNGNYVKKVSCIRGTDINGLNGTDTCNPPTRYILEKNSHKILNSHDLIIEISGGAPTQSTGRLGYITDATLKRFGNPLICSNFCKAISIKDKKHLYNFVYHWNMLYDNDVFFGYEGKTSGIKNLLFDSFVNSHWTVVPPAELVEKFYDFMQEIQAKKQTALLESQTLTELRDWLLPMLMNGQVTVG